MRSRAGSWSLAFALLLCVTLIATGSGSGFPALAQGDGTPVTEAPVEEESPPVELPSETPVPEAPTEIPAPPTEPPVFPTETPVPATELPIDPTVSVTPTPTDIPVEPASTEASTPTPTWNNTWTTLTATTDNCEIDPIWWMYTLVVDGPESVVSGLDPHATFIYRFGGTASMGPHDSWTQIRESPITPGNVEYTYTYIQNAGQSGAIAMVTVDVPDITHSTFELTSAPYCGSFPTPTPTFTYTPTRTMGTPVPVNADLSSCRQGYHWSFKTVIDDEPQYLPSWVAVTFAKSGTHYLTSTSAIWDGSHWTNLSNYYGAFDDTVVSAYAQITGGVNGTITLLQGPTCAPWPPPGSTETPTPTQTTTPSPSPEPLVTQATFDGCVGIQGSWVIRYETSGAFPSAPTLTFTDGSYAVASIEWTSDLGNGVLETNATLKSNLGGQLVSVTLPDRADAQISNFRVVGGPNCTPGTLTGPVWTPTPTSTSAPIPALTDLPLDFSSCQTGPGFTLKLIVSQRPTMDSMNLVFANGSTGWASPVTLASFNASTGRWEVTYGSSSGTANDRLAYASMVLPWDAEPVVLVTGAPRFCELGSIAGYPTRTATSTRTPSPTPSETRTPTTTNTPTITTTSTATATATITLTSTLSPTPTSEIVDLPMDFTGCYAGLAGWFLEMNLPTPQFPEELTLTFASGTTATMGVNSSIWQYGEHFYRNYALYDFAGEQALSVTAELPYGMRGTVLFYGAANCVPAGIDTPTSTASETALPTEAPTETVTSTSTATVTPTETATESATATASNTPTQTASGTATGTSTATVTATATRTHTPTETPTETATATITPTETATATATPMATSTNTETATNTPTEPASATATATATQTSTGTATSTETTTNTPTERPTETTTPTQTATATDTPTGTSTATSTSSATPTATATHTATPSQTATFTSTATGSSTASATATASNTVTGTPAPQVIATANVNCRTGASVGAASLGVVPATTVLPVRGAASSGWTPVVCFGQNGWISSRYLALAPSATATVPSGASVITTARVNCRSGASTGSAIIGVVPARTSLALRGAAQGGWYPVTCFGQSGWISAGYGSPAVTATATSPSGPRAMTTTRVNCRSFPTVNQANVITVLNSGVSVPLRGAAQSGWTPVVCGGQDGWISSQYLRPS